MKKIVPIHLLKPGDQITLDKVVWTILKIKGRARGIQIYWKTTGSIYGERFFDALYDPNLKFEIDG